MILPWDPQWAFQVRSPPLVTLIGHLDLATNKVSFSNDSVKFPTLFLKVSFCHAASHVLITKVYTTNVGQESIFNYFIINREQYPYYNPRQIHSCGHVKGILVEPFLGSIP